MSRARILIVEDEVEIATGLQWLLEAEGLTVHVVGCANDVLPAIERFAPELVLLECRFFERAFVDDLPIIFMTGCYSQRELLQSRDEHAIVLMKPFTTEELLRTIDEILAA